MAIEDLMLVEKHRPETLDDIIGNDEIVETLRSWAIEGNTPHVLLSGPSGTGKTAMTTAFAKDFFGEDWRQNFFELNASDDRGIDVVREKIKPYAEQGVSGDYPYKVLFLDEVDSTSDDAQHALRRVMEDTADTTRFFLSCNYVGQLIEPIQSRCSIFRVEPLDTGDVTEILRQVAEKEGMEYEEDALHTIAEASYGDARKALNTLQAASTGDRIDTESVTSVASVLDKSIIEEIVTKAFAGETDEAQEMLNVEVLKKGVDSETLSKTFLRVLREVDMPEDARILAIDKLAQAEYRTLQGANVHVQWASFVSDLNIVRHLSHESYRKAVKDEEV